MAQRTIHTDRGNGDIAITILADNPHDFWHWIYSVNKIINQPEKDRILDWYKRVAPDLMRAGIELPPIELQQEEE